MAVEEVILGDVAGALAPPTQRTQQGGGGLLRSRVATLTQCDVVAPVACLPDSALRTHPTVLERERHATLVTLLHGFIAFQNISTFVFSLSNNQSLELQNYNVKKTFEKYFSRWL